MGKKSSQAAAMKAPIKHEKKQQTHSPMKILKPKVYITDSSKFKNLVQELTGNGTSPASSPPPCFGSPPPQYAESSLDMSSFDSSCFSSPLEGSPDLRPFDCATATDSYGFDFSSQIMDLEALLMGIDSISNGYDSSGCGALQQEVCVYDYDFSSLV